MGDIHWNSFFFLLSAAVVCCSAVAVVLSSNIVRMACYLVVSLGAVAALFFLAGAEFVGALQLMVYVGGTMVLLVFGVMLTARGPAASLHTGGGQWIVAVIVGGSLLAVLLQTVTSVADWNHHEKQIVAEDTATPLGLGLLGVRVDKTDEHDGRSGYLLPFEIVSVHLVVVLIGAAYLARARRKKTQLPGQENAGQAPPLNVVSDDPQS